MSGVAIRVEGRAGRITLDRPQALNALTHAMVAAIAAALAGWRDDPAVSLVLLDAEGPRAFCAGGDIAAIYEAGRRGDFGFARRFWADEYRLNAAIARYPKPVVALMHGFVMGGGVGIACHASHRVVGESAQVATPECGIGLVPDVGSTHLLGRAPGAFGEYLGLTGARLGPGDAILAGFADRFVPEARWPSLAAALCATGDPAAVAVESAAPPEPALGALREPVDAAFDDAADLAAIAARLETSDWGHAVARTLARHSPLSMACTLELVRAARRDPGIEKALRREYRFTWRSQEDGDLLEGIRAALIDKDRTPTWRHDVDGPRPDEVAAMLAPLDEELTLSDASAGT
jgi:enoyl-CoA hydratase/carnithine racemase